MTELHWCDACAAEVAFERFDCDDHGLDCLELVCTVCGHGVERVGAGIAADVAAVPAEAHEAAA